MKIILSKKQWLKAGQKAGWIKKSMRDIRDVIIDFDSFDFIEDRHDVDNNSRNTWNISYNHLTFEDSQLVDELLRNYGSNTFRFFVELFKAANCSAVNVWSGQKVGAEELTKMVTVDVDAFWNAIRLSDEIYQTERQAERSEIERGEIDTQQPSHSDIYGPDQEKPQY